MSDTAEERWINVDEAAAHFGVRPTTIREWARTGKIPAQKIGKAWKFKYSVLEAWENGNSRTSGSAGIKDGAEVNEK